MKIKLLIICFVILQNVLNAQTVLVPQGSSWKYLDNGSNQATAWRGTSFNDTSWKQGSAQLGYGDGDEATIVNYGSSSSNKFITTYFRKNFSINNISDFVNYTLKVKRDDGVAIYINGKEVYRNNLVSGATHTTLASLATDDGATFLSTSLQSSVFVNGNNTIAVEIHQNAANSSDISFDLELLGNTTSTISNSQKHIRWGTTKGLLEGLTVSWTNSTSATTDKIKWGYTSNYENGISNVTSRAGYSSTTNKFFSFTFPGLITPNTTIYYSLYDSVSGVWSQEKRYTTSPPQNTSSFTFGALGDSRNNTSVWNNISNLMKGKNPAFIVFNGDIVATGNSNTQWNAWFDTGKNLLEEKLILHAQGNHDVASSSYYQNIFDLPKNNTENSELYYSVDYGEAIFICLNSENAGSSTQLTWLKNTLSANVNKKWKIVSFHRPFYTVGPHSGEMNSYFSTWFKAFDDYGVDLILNGHDHMYERFKPINRNVSTSTPVANYGSGSSDGRCEIVCGGAGAPLYTSTGSSLLQTYKSAYHYLIFDVTSTSLCGTTYDSTNTVIDSFCINKSSTTNKQVMKENFYPIKVIPNPIKDVFKVEYNSPLTGEAIITIYDMTGNILLSEKANKSNMYFTYEYNGSPIKKGIYFFEIQMDSQKDRAILIRE